MCEAGPSAPDRDMDLKIACLAAGLLLRLFLAGGPASAEELASPRLGALRQEVKAGGPAALERFWRRLAEEGTPLVEPVEGEGNERLVTFLWRGGGGKRKLPVSGSATSASSGSTRPPATILMASRTVCWSSWTAGPTPPTCRRPPSWTTSSRLGASRPWWRFSSPTTARRRALWSCPAIRRSPSSWGGS